MTAADRWLEAALHSEARIGAAIIRRHHAIRAFADGMRRGLERLEPVLENFVRAMNEVAAAHDRYAFALQRSTVESLLSAPWYRHLRLRWSLRSARRWSE